MEHMKPALMAQKENMLLLIENLFFADSNSQSYV
jgi:hypothetical protein